MEVRISRNELDPKLFLGMLKTEAYLKSSGLDLKLLYLMQIRVSQINGCAFCLDMHYKDAIHEGETELRLYSLPAWRDCPFYSEKEKAALAFAEALTRADQGEIEDTMVEQLLSHYSKQEVGVLTMAISQINAWNRLNKTFRPIPGQYVAGQFDSAIEAAVK